VSRCHHPVLTVRKLDGIGFSTLVRIDCCGPMDSMRTLKIVVNQSVARVESCQLREVGMATHRNFLEKSTLLAAGALAAGATAATNSEAQTQRVFS
jgi:hypothetical protein